MIRVIIADDHKILREGLRALLTTEKDLTVVAEAERGDQALELIEEHRPEVAVLDISMEGLNGLEVTRRVVQDFPQVAVIILSMHDDKHYVIEAIRAGAKGFIVKSGACAELVGAIRAAAQQKRYLSPAIQGALIQELSSRKPDTLLSKREIEVLVGLAEGKCVKEIAFSLNIGTKTVETYRQNLMKKLNITTLADLIKHAIRSGLVPLG